MRSTALASCLFAAAACFSGCGSNDSSTGSSPQTNDSGTPADDAATGDDVADDGGTVDAHGDDGGTKPDASPFVPAPHPAWPQVPSNQGRILKPMKLVTVVSAGDTLANQLFAFSDALIVSNWWQAAGKDYGLGNAGQSIHVTGPAITQNPSGNAMRSYITNAIQGNGAAAPDGNTMYILYLPSGIDALDQRGPNTNCQYYGGYHTEYGQGGDGWGFGQRCPTQGTGLSELQSLTIIGSHEIMEGATDPVPGLGWTLGTPDYQQPWTQTPWLAAVQGEVGDLCFGTEIPELGNKYQRIWSNSAAAAGGDPCAPALPDPYYNTSAPQGWYALASGGSTQITVTGFSDHSMLDWIIEPTVWIGSTNGWTASITSPTTKTIQNKTYPTTNNGKSATLTINAPTAASGSWAVVMIISSPELAMTDPYHVWPVGVHIQ
jgi:hypothetical protein